MSISNTSVYLHLNIKNMKKILLLSICATSVAFASDVFVSSTGGDYSSLSTWETVSGGSLSSLPASTDTWRMNDQSGVLNIDEDATLLGASLWGKAHSITIAQDKTFTLGTGIISASDGVGFNIGSTTTNISGDGTFIGGANTGTYKENNVDYSNIFVGAYGEKVKGNVSNVLVVYGAKGGTYNISSAAKANGIVFKDRSGTYDSKGGTINFLGSFTTATSSVLYIKGLNATTPANVNFKGSVTLSKEVIIQNYANVTIDTNKFTTSAWIGVRGNSTLKLVGNGSGQYDVSAKVRLNGNATLILEGDNVYKSGSATRINAEGSDNKLVINGSQKLDGLCLVGKGSDVKTFYIDLTNTTLLELTHLTVQPGGDNYFKTDSLTEYYTSWANKTSKVVDNLFIEFINFENGKVKLANDLLSAEDWKQVKADGWENFRLENGYITATEVIPEPAEWAVIFGAIALVFVAYKRRR